MRKHRHADADAEHHERDHQGPRGPDALHQPRREERTDGGKNPNQAPVQPAGGHVPHAAREPRRPRQLFTEHGQRRGVGVGRVFYADVQSFSEVRAERLAAEVFLENSNHSALLFHGSFGFREVGQHVMPGPGLRAAMLVKELCSYPFVRQTYGGALPDKPWLAARAIPGRKPQLATGT